MQKEWAQKPVWHGASQRAGSLEVSKVRGQALAASPRFPSPAVDITALVKEGQNLGGHKSKSSNLNGPSEQTWESDSAYVNRTEYLFCGFSVHLHTPEPDECFSAQFCLYHI